MPKRSEKPIEDREYGLFFILLAGILAFSTFWAILDMLSFRAPWQRYQKQLNKLEYRNIAGQLHQTQEKFKAQNTRRLNELTEQLEQAKVNLEGQAYEDLLFDLEQSDVNIEVAMQEYRFAKSEYDALWYEYKNAEHAADNSKIPKLRAKVDALNKEVHLLKLNWDAAEARKLDLETRLDRYRVAADSLQREIDVLVAPVEEIKKKIELVKDRKIAVQQFVLQDFVRGYFENYLDQVDRCTSCHINTDKAGFDDYEVPFQTHPNRDLLLKTHPVNQFGCSPCHEGQGTALQVNHAHGYDKHWEHPLLHNEFVESGCNKCHNKELYLGNAPSLSKAKRMVFDLGCYGCHEIAGYENARKIGPPLEAINSKTTTEFIFQWVKDTKSFRKHSRMPNPQFSDEEAMAVTAYLNKASKESNYKPPRAPSGGSVNRGKRLVESLGCKGCHVVTESDREFYQSDVTYDLAPELSRIGDKVNRNWLYAWIKNPKQYNPNTTMPGLRLTNSEVRDIVAYLMTNKESDLPVNNIEEADLESEQLITEGRAIVRNFGCHGCHDIPGMEGEGKVSVALDEFGAKKPEELFFGDALARGDVLEESWEAWTKGKLMNSRLYTTEAVSQRMPNFAFSDKDATTLSLLLKSWDGRKIGVEYLPDLGRFGDAKEQGRRLVRQYNCVNCHVIEGQGGYIRSIIVEAIKKEGRPPEEVISFAPPNLIGEGKKVQPKWLFEYLKNPTTKIRPWLNVRMPTFGFNDDEVNRLIEYFQALDGMSEPFLEIDIELTRTEIRAAERLYSKQFLSCYSCHQVGKKKPEGPPSGWSPDFLLAPDRLNPQWVYDWIENPQALQPGTKMPAFYPDAIPPNILNGDQHKQIEALTDYLMSIRRFVSE